MQSTSYILLGNLNSSRFFARRPFAMPEDKRFAEKVRGNVRAEPLAIRTAPHRAVYLWKRGRPTVSTTPPPLKVIDRSAHFLLRRVRPHAHTGAAAPLFNRPLSCYSVHPPPPSTTLLFVNALLSRAATSDKFAEPFSVNERSRNCVVWFLRCRLHPSNNFLGYSEIPCRSSCPYLPDFFRTYLLLI